MVRDPAGPRSELFREDRLEAHLAAQNRRIAVGLVCTPRPTSLVPSLGGFLRKTRSRVWVVSAESQKGDSPREPEVFPNFSMRLSLFSQALLREVHPPQQGLEAGVGPWRLSVSVGGGGALELGEPVLHHVDAVRKEMVENCSPR